MGDDGIRLIADALVGNEVIEVLDINGNEISFNGLDEITRMLMSTRLQKMDMAFNEMAFRSEASTRRFARALSRHEFLEELDLCRCRLGDEGIQLIANALVGNTIMEVLSIQGNEITHVGLAAISQLLESTQLETLAFGKTVESLMYLVMRMPPNTLSQHYNIKSPGYKSYRGFCPHKMNTFQQHLVSSSTTV
jgi:Leucine Rich repeat